MLPLGVHWKDADGNDVALHGVDVITVRDWKIAEKLTYGTLQTTDAARPGPRTRNGVNHDHGHHLS